MLSLWETMKGRQCIGFCPVKQGDEGKKRRVITVVEEMFSGV